MKEKETWVEAVERQSAEQLRLWAAEHCGFQRASDLRPFLTLVRLLGQSGRTISCRGEAGLDIVTTNGRGNQLHGQNILQVISIAKDVNRSLISKATGSYQVMCLEENDEELELLLEQAKKFTSAKNSLQAQRAEPNRPALYVLGRGEVDYLAAAEELQALANRTTYDPTPDEWELAVMGII